MCYTSTSCIGHISWKKYLEYLTDKFTGRWGDVLLLTLEDSTSFSQFSG